MSPVQSSSWQSSRIAGSPRVTWQMSYVVSALSAPLREGPRTCPCPCGPGSRHLSVRHPSCRMLWTRGQQRRRAGWALVWRRVGRHFQCVERGRGRHRCPGRSQWDSYGRVIRRERAALTAHTSNSEPRPLCAVRVRPEWPPRLEANGAFVVESLAVARLLSVRFAD